MAYDTIVIENNPVNVLESFHEELNQDEFEIQSVISRDMGGFWSAKFSILNPRRNEALQMLANGPGRSVKFFNEKSICVWEGFISKVTVDTGAASSFNDIQPVANKVWVRYRDVITGNLLRSTVASHANSQTRYGHKDWVLSGGQLAGVVAEQKAENYLNLNFWATPQLDSFEIGGGGRGDIDLQIQCLGWWHTLNWRVYTQTLDVGSVNTSTLMEEIIGTFQFVSNSVKDNLISWWTLDEFSTGAGAIVRVDSHGANDLTDNGTTPSAAGQVNLATQHTNAVPDWLSHVSNASLQVGDIDFTVACWAYLDNKVGVQVFAGKDEPGVGANREWAVLYNAGPDRFGFSTFTPVGVAHNLSANLFGVPAAATWYLIIAWYEAATNTMSIQVDNGGIDTLGTGGALQAAAAAEFQIGSRDGPNSPLDGRVDEVGFWKRLLTVSERSALWNDGAGIGYDEIGETVHAGGIGEFVAGTVIESNATQVTREYDADRRADGIIKAAAELGDSTGLIWNAYMGLDRIFYFESSAPPFEETL
jgi:hypothetical protein